MRERYLVFGSPAFQAAEVAEVLDTIASGWVGTGPKTHRFEAEFAAYLGAKHCVAVNSCTSALHLSLLAAGVGPGDEVIVPAMTFCASANAVIHAGARPVFADVDPVTMNLDAQDAARRVTRRTKALLPVHLHGRPCDMAPLRALARKRGLLLIADAAHAIEALDRGRRVADLADLTCFSFYVTKNLTTVEGGMVATPNGAWADRIKVLASHGMSRGAWARFSDQGYKHYEVTEPGFKCRMTDLQASFGLHQLRRIEKNLARREALWERYDRALAGQPLLLPAPPAAGTRHARHLYAIRTTAASGLGRDELMAALHRRRIGTGVHYTALSLHPYYRRAFGCKPGDFPNAEAIGAATLSLPLSAGMTDADARDVVEAVKACLAAAQRQQAPRSGRPRRRRA
jgi:dTDP-4-amino-4,6-dideoxygalactose transaminase